MNRYYDVSSTKISKEQFDALVEREKLFYGHAYVEHWVTGPVGLVSERIHHYKVLDSTRIQKWGKEK